MIKPLINQLSYLGGPILYNYIPILSMKSIQISIFRGVLRQRAMPPGAAILCDSETCPGMFRWVLV